jgi:hypothetical protein
MDQAAAGSLVEDCGCVLASRISLELEVAEGFLRYGTAKSAAPPVGMTNYLSFFGPTAGE